MAESEPTPAAETTAAPASNSSPGRFSIRIATTGQSGNQLFTVGLTGVAALLVYYAYSAKTDDPIHLYLGLMMIVGATLPALLWSRRKDQRFPVFEVLMLTGVNTYAIPLLGGHDQLQVYSAETITNSAFGIVLYQFVANSKKGSLKGTFNTEGSLRSCYRSSSRWGANLMCDQNFENGEKDSSHKNLNLPLRCVR